MKYLNKETNGITLSRIGLGAMRMADVQQESTRYMPRWTVELRI